MTNQKKHIIEEGSHQHTLRWDSTGQHCSEPDCEINTPPTTGMEERFDKKFLYTSDTIATIEGYKDEIKAFIHQELSTQKAELIREVVGEIKALQTPESNVACDYEFHVDKDEVIALLTSRLEGK